MAPDYELGRGPSSRTFALWRQYTVKVAVPVAPFALALIVLVPLPTLTAVPRELIVATLGLEEFHVTDRLMFCTVPSLKDPIALKF